MVGSNGCRDTAGGEWCGLARGAEVVPDRDDGVPNISTHGASANLVEVRGSADRPSKEHYVHPMRDRMRAVLGALSIAGVVGTHLMAYAFTEPALGLRAPAIFASAHNHWNYLVAAALAASAWGLSRYVSDRVEEERVPPDQVAMSALPRLTVLHMSGFLVLEFLETSFTGGDVHHLLSQKPILLGLVVALIMAALGSVLLGLIAATVDFVSRTVSKFSSPACDGVSIVPSGFTPPCAFDPAAWGLRGPPASLL